jgi:nitrate reductase gamma subunit
LNILTEEVTTNILDMLVLLGVTLLLDRRLVSLPPRELVVLGDKLLQLLLRLIIDKTT